MLHLEIGMTNFSPPSAPASAGPVVTRRRLLGGGLIGAAAVGLGGLGWRLFATKVPAEAFEVLTPTEAEVVAVGALALFPPGNGLGLDGLQAGVPGYIDRYFGAMDTPARTFTRSMFWLLDQGTLISGHVRPMRKLDPASARRYLDEWSASRLQFRQLIVMSFRTILGMAFTAHPQVRKTIGMTPVCRQTGPSFLPPEVV